MKHLYPYLRRFRKESILAPLFKMLEASFDLFVPLVMADIVNVGIAANDFHYILTRCGILLLLLLSFRTEPEPNCFPAGIPDRR